MQEQFIRGGMKSEANSILGNQQGNILILGLFSIIIIFILFFGMVEFGRLMIMREQLQTAADSAALAGAGSGTHRYVKINVITDRGQKVVCGKEDCWCSGCSTIRIRNIVGNEKNLIDEGDWQNFCVPECDCGGGDCWFELVDRDMMYDTHSVSTAEGWGTDPREIKNARSDLTIATREAISEYCYPYQSEMRGIFYNKSLEQMSSIISSTSNFLPHWMHLKGYSTNCYNECRGPWGYRSECDECQRWRSRGQSIYNTKISSRKSFVNGIIKTMNNMEQINTKKIPKIDEQYTKSSGQFFDANLPQYAKDAGIIKLDVYGFESRNNPKRSKYYPSVVVYAKAKLSPLFINDKNTYLKGFELPPIFVCSQGTTAYKDVNYQKSLGNKFYGALNPDLLKWRKLPEQACPDFVVNEKFIPRN